MQQPFDVLAITPQSSIDAYKAMLKHAGASHSRDTLDARILQNIVKGDGNIIDVQGGYPHGTAYEKTVNAWPALKALPTPVDTDKDGTLS